MDSSTRDDNSEVIDVAFTVKDRPAVEAPPEIDDLMYRLGAEFAYGIHDFVESFEAATQDALEGVAGWVEDLTENIEQHVEQDLELQRLIRELSEPRNREESKHE